MTARVGERVLTPNRIANVVQVASLGASFGLFVGSILLLTRVAPGGLPIAIATGTTGVLNMSGMTLWVVFGGKKNREGKTPLRKMTPFRVALLVLGLLVGGSLISLGGLYAFSIIQGTSLLSVNQFAWGVIGTLGSGLVLGTGIGLIYAFRPATIERMKDAKKVGLNMRRFRNLSKFKTMRVMLRVFFEDQEEKLRQSRANIVRI